MPSRRDGWEIHGIKTPKTVPFKTISGIDYIAWKIRSLGFPGGSVVKKKTRLPMRETQIQSLIWEGATCFGSTEPSEARSCNCWAHSSSSWSLHALKPVLHSKRTTAMRSPPTAVREKPTQHADPAQPKINKQKLKKKNGEREKK